jgi:hypothetical protein
MKTWHSKVVVLTAASGGHAMSTNRVKNVISGTAFRIVFSRRQVLF